MKAYVALIEFGSMIAAEVSRQSGVPYSKIYEVLSSLERKGWIETDRSRPSKFYPKPPAVAAETTRMKQEAEQRENETVALEELSPLYEKRGVREKPEIWIVRGEFNIISKVKEMLGSCNRELMVALPSKIEGLTHTLGPQLSKLFEKNVKIMVMTAKSADETLLKMLGKGVETRLREQMFGGGVISDSAQVMLLLGEEKEGSSPLAIWADHVGLAKFARDYFEYLWNDSQPYEAK